MYASMEIHDTYMHTCSLTLVHIVPLRVAIRLQPDVL